MYVYLITYIFYPSIYYINSKFELGEWDQGTEWPVSFKSARFSVKDHSLSLCAHPHITNEREGHKSLLANLKNLESSV